MKLSLYYPIKPLHINQPFGANPDYYARFKDASGNPEKGHMGIDFMAVHGQPVYAPIDGIALFIKDEHGGEGIHIITDPLDYSGGTCWFDVILWHLIGDTDPTKPMPIKDGDRVSAGDLIGYADNTGAPFESSGDHLHLGLLPVDSNRRPIAPNNGFGGCLDPQPYLNGLFAVDIQIGLINKLIDLINAIINWGKTH